MFYSVGLGLMIVLQQMFHAFNQKLSYRYDEKYHVHALTLSALVFTLVYAQWVLPVFSAAHIQPLDWSSAMSIFFSPSLMIFLLTIVVLVSISIVDYLYYEIPNEYNALVFLLGIAWAYKKAMLADGFVAALVLFLVFFLLMVITKGQLGAGDVKLVAGLGWFLGKSSILPFLMYSFFVAAFVSVILLATKKKKKEDRIPFGPFLCTGFFMVFLL